MKKITITNIKTGYSCGIKECPDNDVQNFINIRINKTQLFEVPEDANILIEDITSEYEASQLRASRLSEGKKARQCCSDILDFIGGYNVERELTLLQIQQLLVDFSSAYSALQANMPRTVRTILSSMSPSELISQELLDEVALILTKHGY